MNAEMQVLQALDAAQAALKQLPRLPAPERARAAHRALEQTLAAPWSLATRPEEAEQHGWLAQLQEALQRIEREPEGPEADRLTEEGLWAANELERDLRGLLRAR
jgi:hypothetical protein